MNIGRQNKDPNSNYMGSGLAQTLDQKTSKPISSIPGGHGLAGNASAQSLNYAVPSMDGRLLPAIPINIAAKFKPPTIAVVYNIKDGQKTKCGQPINKNE